MVDAAKLEAAINSFHGAGRTAGSVTDCGYITVDGKYARNGNHACHAGLSYIADGQKLKYIISGSQKLLPDVSEKEALTWIDYFINRSPYAAAIVTKNAKEVINRHYLFDVDKPANLVAGGCITSRFYSEHSSGGTKLFHKLMEMGRERDGDYAMLFSHMFRYDGKAMTYSPTNSHNAFYPTMYSNEYHQNYVNHVIPAKNKQRDFQEYRRIDNCGGMWGTERNEGGAKWATKLVPRTKTKKNNYNIFENLVRKGEYYSFNTDADIKDAFEQYKEWVNA